MLDALMILPAIPGFKGLVVGVVMGAIRGRTLNPMAALRKIGWVDYFAGYASGLIAGFVMFEMH